MDVKSEVIPFSELCWSLLWSVMNKSETMIKFAFCFITLCALQINSLSFGFKRVHIKVCMRGEPSHDSRLKARLPAAALIASTCLITTPLLADAVNLDIFSGRTASLLHPATNLALFGTSLYSAYLGLQWRRLRDIGEEIKELSRKLPTLSSGPVKSPLSASFEKFNMDLQQLMKQNSTPEVTAQIALLKSDLQKLRDATELDDQIVSLVAIRKSLLSANLKDKHHLTGSILLGVGVTVSILGAYNTFLRTGKLFPGPHLYAGMAITILWAGT